ncbi:unnamed protein product [Chironomus riparius]|uniref:Transmembrane protein n=1 Tax=Chironomus riparius TaxID=315576 RepID=A0A9N9S4Q9_9DIPT|nr:unnamed protein product [Chironomus riparius]
MKFCQIFVLTSVCCLTIGFAAVALKPKIKSIVDEMIYGKIHLIVKSQHAKNPKLIKCIMDVLMENETANKCYAFDVMFNQDTFKSCVQPFIDGAKSQCGISRFSQQLIFSISIVFLLIFPVIIYGFIHLIFYLINLFRSDA